MRKDVFVCDRCGVEGPTRFDDTHHSERLFITKGTRQDADLLRYGCPPEAWVYVAMEQGRSIYVFCGWECAAGYCAELAG